MKLYMNDFCWYEATVDKVQMPSRAVWETPVGDIDDLAVDLATIRASGEAVSEWEMSGTLAHLYDTIRSFDVSTIPSLLDAQVTRYIERDSDYLTEDDDYVCTFRLSDRCEMNITPMMWPGFTRGSFVVGMGQNQDGFSCLHLGWYVGFSKKNIKCSTERVSVLADCVMGTLQAVFDNAKPDPIRLPPTRQASLNDLLHGERKRPASD